MKFSILLPIYCGSNTLGDALESIRSALIDEITLTVFVLDDNHPNNFVEISKTYQILRESKLNIDYNKSCQNLGYSSAMNFLYSKVSSGVVVYFAQDDLLSKNFFSQLLYAYSNGACFTSRSFGMFEHTPKNIVREMPPLHIPGLFSLLDLNENQLRVFMFSLSQLSGLSFLKNFSILKIHSHTFTAHIYPLISVALNHPGIYFDDYQVLCRIETSQTKFAKKIYTPPPTSQWMDMINSIFPLDSIQNNWMRIDRSKNFDGLNQILLYSGRTSFFKEIIIMMKINPYIILNINIYIWLILQFFPKKIILIIGNLVKQYRFRRLSKSQRVLNSINNFIINKKL